MQWFAIAAGGALGALSRYWMVAMLTVLMGRSFPWATLLVNVSGSFAMGIAYVFIVDKLGGHPELRALMMVGFLGAFTTFSTFSLETLQLLQQGQFVKALAYILSSVILCVAGTALGVALGRSLV